MHKAHLDGTPILNPLWYKYPSDANTFPIDLQFLYGDSVLVYVTAFSNPALMMIHH